jgi:DNA repair protein RecN (Recombination protein N)
VSELAKFLQKYNSGIEFNPERLEAIRERLGHLTLLKKKYGGSVEAVRTLREQIGRESALAENFQQELDSLEKEYSRRRTVCSRIAERLSAKRIEVASRVSTSIEKSLESLGIRNSRFEARIEQIAADESARPIVRLGRESYAAGPSGIDRVEFFLSTNAGEEVKPLAKVASGGEVSRIMLAMKMILAKSERLPLLVFDEIDVGVSGRIAQAVGKALKDLSRLHQVIAITHLPQIAGLADTHIVVEKEEKAGRARTTLRRLDLDERVHEVARLMSGLEVTAAGLRGAKELMGLK